MACKVYSVLFMLSTVCMKASTDSIKGSSTTSESTSSAGHNSTTCTATSNNNTQEHQSNSLYYIIAVLSFTSLLALTLAVAYKRKRKHPIESTSLSLRELEEDVVYGAGPRCYVFTKIDFIDVTRCFPSSDCKYEIREKKVRLEIGPTSTYNLRGSVALLTEIDHTAPVGPQPQPKQVSSDYFNVRFFKISTKGLDATVQTMKETGQIFTEFEGMPSGLLEMYNHATRKEIMKRNRYKGIFPFNHSRVILTKEQHNGVKYPEYINACFIHGFRKENAYIAAQGPFTNDTMVDFWRMVWQKENKQVVMLTNIIEGSTIKCLKYWPDEEEEYGPLHVKAIEEKISPNFTVRSFLVSKELDERLVTQYHFTAWPDKGVPTDTQAILDFREKISNDRDYEEDNAMIVHCSAGIGRTGTFIALDSLLMEGTLTGQIDVINCVSKMRQQRVSVIQTPEQYVYLYETLADGLKNVEVTECLPEDSTKQKVNSVKLLGPKSAMPLPISEERTSPNGSLVAENPVTCAGTEDVVQSNLQTISSSQNGAFPIKSS